MCRATMLKCRLTPLPQEESVSKCIYPRRFVRKFAPKSAPFDAEDLLVMRLFDAGAVDAALKDITDMEQKVATMLSDFAREHNISLKPPRTRS